MAVELSIGDLAAALSGVESPGRSSATRERLDALLTALASVLDGIEEGEPLPVGAEHVERIAEAMRAFPGLRRHRYVAHRLGIGGL